MYDPVFRHVVIQHRTVPSLEPNPETYFEVQFHAFGQLNGQLKPAEVIFGRLIFIYEYFSIAKESNTWTD